MHSKTRVMVSQSECQKTICSSTNSLQGLSQYTTACVPIFPQCEVAPSPQQTTRLQQEKRKEKTTPFGVNLVRSHVLYQAAQDTCSKT